MLRWTLEYICLLELWFSQGLYPVVGLLSCGEGNGTTLQYSCLENPMDGGAWWAAVHEVAKSWTRLSDLTFTFHFHALEKEMATHSSVLAWRIPGTGQPGGLPSMGSHRVGHDWSDLAAAAWQFQSYFVKKSPYCSPQWLCQFTFLLKEQRCCCCCVASVVSDSVRPHRWRPPGSPPLGFSRCEHWSGEPLPSQKSSRAPFSAPLSSMCYFPSSWCIFLLVSSLASFTNVL